MLVHTVLFWLRKDLQGDEVTHFRMGLESLKKIESAEAAFIGAPAETPERSVVDTSYDFCLTVIFKNVSDHDAYQSDELHTAFIEQFNSYWSRVKIYDAD